MKRALQPSVTGLEIDFDLPSGFEVFQAPSSIPTIFNGDKIVIYGILKSKAASDTPLQSGVQGKASLKGQIPDKTITHSISFDIPAPPLMGDDQLESCTGFNLPVVHHLAAKSLLSDWKSGKGWGSIALTHEREQESTNLSIESSVICEHTAFVAIDEEQNKSIEGAIIVHDITATLIQPSTSVRACHFSLKPSGLYKTEGATMAITPRVRHAERARRQMSNTLGHQSEKECNSTISVRQYEVPNVLSSDALRSLISLQHATGYWLLKDISEKIVKKSEAEMQCPPNISKEAWATIVALFFLECKYSEQKDEWELITLKAEMWLSTQILPSSIKSLKEIAKTVI